MALTHYLDIHSPIKTNLLHAFSQYAQNPDEKKHLLLLSSIDGRELYQKYVINSRRNLSQILRDHLSIVIASHSSPTSPSAPGNPSELSVGDILELLPRLQCRYYSISSSPKIHSTSVHITASIIRYRTPSGHLVEGVTTSYLERVCRTSYAHCERRGTSTTSSSIDVKPSDRIPIFIRTSSFKLPKFSRPIIMVGPGTGVAPFRGFIQEREWMEMQRSKSVLKPAETSDNAPSPIIKDIHPLQSPIFNDILPLQSPHIVHNAPGQLHILFQPAPHTLLFFGCRHRNEDFLYREDWGDHSLRGASSSSPSTPGITHLYCAFSRELADKLYVHHLISNNSATKQLIWNLLKEKQAHLYICGF